MRILGKKNKKGQEPKEEEVKPSGDEETPGEGGEQQSWDGDSPGEELKGKQEGEGEEKPLEGAQPPGEGEPPAGDQEPSNDPPDVPPLDDPAELPENAQPADKAPFNLVRSKASICGEIHHTYLEAISNCHLVSGPAFSDILFYAGITDGLAAGEDVSPRQIHRSLVLSLSGNGWKIGEELDEEEKTHPHICAWSELPRDDQKGYELLVLTARLLVA